VAAVLVLLVVPAPAAVVPVDVESALEMRGAEVDTGVSAATELLRGVAEGVGVAVWRMRETEREYCWAQPAVSACCQSWKKTGYCSRKRT
jgi:hypothetical protein